MSTEVTRLLVHIDNSEDGLNPDDVRLAPKSSLGLEGKTESKTLSRSFRFRIIDFGRACMFTEDGVLPGEAEDWAEQMRDIVKPCD